MIDFSLHILDIAENSIRADAKTIIIDISEDEQNDKLTICVQDDGLGMNKETVENVQDPFFTTKKGKKVGLGLSLLSQAAQEADGDLEITSKPGYGTKIKADFKLSHPDIRPMGNILETVSTLIVGFPSVRFIYNYNKGDDNFHFDSNQQADNK